VEDKTWRTKRGHYRRRLRRLLFVRLSRQYRHKRQFRRCHLHNHYPHHQQQQHQHQRQQQQYHVQTLFINTW